MPAARHARTFNLAEAPSRGPSPAHDKKSAPTAGLPLVVICPKPQVPGVRTRKGPDATIGP
jgi:hypothetical protein